MNEPVRGSRAPRWCAPLACLALASVLTLPRGADAQGQQERLAPSVVRVLVRTAKDSARAASGFVLQQPTFVVTSLHAVAGRTLGILVECRGQKVEARVARIHRASDLALLELQRPLEKCPVLQHRTLDAAPLSDTRLLTFGFHEGAEGGTGRTMRKEYALKENLAWLLNPQVKISLGRLGMPDTLLAVYYVQGGLLPGYSGAPVIDEQERLVGIVDGGLNQGQSGYNWVIPARNLPLLLASGEPPASATSGVVPSSLFSSGLASAEEFIKAGVGTMVTRTAPERAYIASSAGGIRTRWTRTKTLTLDQLATTADDPEGLLRLVTLFGAAGLEAAKQLRFDIYQESDRGLIIAAPAGVEPTFKRSDLGIESDVGTIEYRRLPGVDRRTGRETDSLEFAIESRPGVWVSASDPAFFTAVANSTHAECAKDPTRRCNTDAPTIRAINFLNGNKLLRFGMIEQTVVGGRVTESSYHYFNVAIHGSTAFTAEAELPVFAGKVDVVSCRNRTIPPASCAGAAYALAQLQYLAAVNLTTIAGQQGTSNRRTVDTTFATAPQPPSSQPPPAGNVPLGWSATRAVAAMPGTGTPGLVFQNVAPFIWVERLATGGPDRAVYREQQRDDWSVYLTDNAGRPAIQIDWFRHKVSTSPFAQGPKRDLYDVMIESPPPVYPLGRVATRAAVAQLGTTQQVSHFELVAPGVWIEHGERGAPARFKFREVNRDDWSVYLHDDERNVDLQIDLYRKKVRYGDGARPMGDLYDVIPER
ncbi:MAG: serine protease [Gemmatimonadetes bacterium]|nr:serine protease [Gemmatimonadota bacterium]